MTRRNSDETIRGLEHQLRASGDALTAKALERALVRAYGPWLEPKLAALIDKADPAAAENPESVYNHPIQAACLESGRPYYGAIGGALTYSFTPTSLGTVVKVKHGFTDAEIDLSDYDQW
jgi:hypothetical protein